MGLGQEFDGGLMEQAKRFADWATHSKLARLALGPVALISFSAMDVAGAPSAAADNSYNVTFDYSPNNGGEIDFSLNRINTASYTDQSVFLTLNSPDSPSQNLNASYQGDMAPSNLTFIEQFTNLGCHTFQEIVYIGTNNSQDFSQANPIEVGSATGKPCDGTYTTTSSPNSTPPPASPQCSTTLPSGSVIGMAETADGQGYWIASSTGQVAACGDAPQLAGGLPDTAAIAAAPDGQGYWLTTKSGQVEARGSAQDHGGIPVNVHLAKAIVAMAADPKTGGYWLLGGDGGVFSFDAPFYGSTGNIKLNKPAVGMESTLDGQGYRFVASDGGVFDFGDAPFYGSTGNIKLNKPVVGLANDPTTGGYWEDASDGGIFSFNAPFYGSTGNIQLNKPCVGMTATPDGRGYRFVASDGGVFDFGDAGFYGSAAG